MSMEGPHKDCKTDLCIWVVVVEGVMGGWGLWKNNAQGSSILCPHLRREPLPSRAAEFIVSILVFIQAVRLKLCLDGFT